MKKQDLNNFEAEFISFINSYIKKQTGKGPRETEVRFVQDTIVYYIRGILTERESVLIQEKEGKRIVLESRRLFLELDKEHRIATLEKFLNCKIVDHYESWNLENDSAVGVLKLEQNIFD